MPRILIAAILTLLFAPAPAAAQPLADDSFIAGYATALVERGMELCGIDLVVGDGHVTATTPPLPAGRKPELQALLSGIDGVRSVSITVDPERSCTTTTADATPDAADTGAQAPPDPPNAHTTRMEKGGRILPKRGLFTPLAADPRWPHFSASYRYFDEDPDVKHAAAVGFGEKFSLYRNEAFGGEWELNFQAGVFGLFDLNSDSFDLVNADYLVGIPVSFRKGDVSAMARVYHQSSHLGDEFLLRGTTIANNRVNLSFEAVDALLSWDMNETWRLYGGSGYIFHHEPATLDPWMLQGGAEYRHGHLWQGRMRPVAALDVQSREESGWAPDISAKAGVELANPGLSSQRIRLMAEYYDGRNPNGQFYIRDLTYYGLGLHIYFE